METMELLQYLRFREVQKILDELLRQRLIDPVIYDMVLRKYQRICSNMLYENVKIWRTDT